MSHPAVHPVEAPPPLTTENAAAAAPRVRMKDLQGMAGTPGGLVLRLFQSFFAIGAFLVMSTTSDFPSVTAFRFLVAASGLQILWSLSLAMLDIYAILVKRNFRNRRAVSLFAAGDVVLSFGFTTAWTIFILSPFSFYCNVEGIYGILGEERDKKDPCDEERDREHHWPNEVMLQLICNFSERNTWIIIVGRPKITSTLIFSAACASAGITVLIGNDLQSCSKNHCAQFETSTGMAFMTWFAALPSFLLNFWSLASR